MIPAPGTKVLYMYLTILLDPCDPNSFKYIVYLVYMFKGIIVYAILCMNVSFSFYYRGIPRNCMSAWECLFMQPILVLAILFTTIIAVIN